MSVKWTDPKDPADVAWYAVDCTSFLDGDTIATATWTAPSGITKVAESHTDTEARIKVSGGTNATTYTLTLDLTTAGGQTFQRTVALRVREL